MNCGICSAEIPKERIEAIPGTTTCVKCSGVKNVHGFMVFGHKTGGELVMISPDNTEAMRQAQRSNKRSR
jgi:hypothetical protein|tara:strand:+ start:679 stop:888 length:210 start_codon:yes stop_codon:yes gene_type:complete